MSFLHFCLSLFLYRCPRSSNIPVFSEKEDTVETINERWTFPLRPTENFISWSGNCVHQRNALPLQRRLSQNVRESSKLTKDDAVGRGGRVFFSLVFLIIAIRPTKANCAKCFLISAFFVLCLVLFVGCGSHFPLPFFLFPSQQLLCYLPFPVATHNPQHP